MKALGRGALSAVLALAICGIGGPPAQAADTLVNVPDAALRACFQKALTDAGKPTDLTAANLAALETVGCYSGGVTDLTGAEHLLGVRTFTVAGSAVAELAPITGLAQLWNLQVQSTASYDLDPLESLPSLTKLLVSVQEGTDPAPLARLTTLNALYLHTSLTRLPGVRFPPSLEKLYVSGSRLTDLGSFSGGSALSFLHVSSPQLTSLDGLELMTSVTELSCSTPELSRISAIGVMARLKRLDLYHAQVSDLSPLQGMTQLATLNLAYNQVTTIDALQGAPLQTINLSDNKITDLGPLSGIASDATVHIERNQVRDLSPLPDAATVFADDQTVTFPESASVGAHTDLGIRGLAGEHLCPMFTPEAECTAGVVTYPQSGTYQAALFDQDTRLAFSFTQHAGPDRAFTITSAPTIDRDLYVGWSTGLRILAWGPQVDHFTYEWFKDGAPIPDLDPNYADLVTTTADIGHHFSVCATGHADGVVPTRRCSNTATVVSGLLLYPSYPPIVGSPVTDSVLSVDSRFWTPGVTLSYRWQKNHRNIRGATAATYRVRASDVGDRIQAIVTGTRQDFGSKTVRSHTVRPKKAVFTAPTPMITGVAKVGQRLTATPGAWVPSSAHLSYRWYRNGKAISHATEATYLLKAKDRGKVIKVRVSASRAGYVTKRVYSLPTAKVA